MDRLIAAGYVSRSRGASDRRRILVELEPATWQAFAALYYPLGQLVAASAEGLSARERAGVIAALRQMTEAFDAARATIIS